MNSRNVDRRFEEYWDWFSVALFVLISVDMLTTIFAGQQLGPAGEANPLVRQVLGAGVLPLVVVNLAAVILTTAGFALLLRFLERTRTPLNRYMRVAVEAWLGLLIAGGLFVFANNLYALFHGQSLVLIG